LLSFRGKNRDQHIHHSRAENRQGNSAEFDQEIFWGTGLRIMNQRLTRRLSVIEQKFGRTYLNESCAINSQLLSQLSDADLDLLEQALTLVESGQETALSNVQRGALDHWEQIHSVALAASKEKNKQGNPAIRSSRGVR
jgi:hypothetical protein